MTQQIYIDPNSIQAPNSVRQFVPQIVQLVVNDIYNKRDSHPARQYIFQQCSQNPQNNQNFISIVKRVADVSGMFIDMHRLNPEQAVHTAIAKVMDIKTSVLYRDNPNMTGGLQGDIINSIRQTLAELPQFEQSFAQYVGLLQNNSSGFNNNSGNAVYPSNNNVSFGNSNNNNTPAMGGLAGAGNNNNFSNNNNSFGSFDVAATSTPDVGGFGFGAAAFDLPKPKQENPVMTVKVMQPTAAPNTGAIVPKRKSRVITKMQDGSVSQHVQVNAEVSEPFVSRPDPSFDAVATNTYTVVDAPQAVPVQEKPVIIARSEPAEAELVDESPALAKRQHCSEFPYAVVFNPLYYDTNLFAHGDVIVEEIVTEKGLPINLTGEEDVFSTMGFSEEEIDAANRAWLAESTTVGEGDDIDRVSVWRGIGSRVIKTNEGEEPLRAEIEKETPVDEIVFDVDVDLGEFMAPTLDETLAIISAELLEENKTLPDAYTFAYTNRTAFIAKSIDRTAIDDMFLAYTLDTVYECMGAINASFDERTFKRLDLVLTNLINEALQDKMGMGDWSIDSFSKSYEKLLAALREKSTYLLSTFTKHSVDIVKAFKGNASFTDNGALPPLVDGVLRMNWKTFVAVLPITSSELALNCKERSGLINPLINPHTFAVFNQILHRASTQHQMKVLGVKLITSDGDVIDLMRGYFDEDALIIKFNERVE